ncbi:hypothetical protein CVD25_11650 [Bacillus canaveralius]|uniref:Uncharacterized protein n=1 Tax=Bacillus canaveralius TaxID=1403243 RepID=A0A2N5GMS5_9BACI|nr:MULTISPECIES: hypothetical protein [Bacillus]PLR83281.1 hypothetical protein CU635_09515 [Bacillus canaveralius]PLR87783.1 hypothetical protein CVD23_00970 [Bacillus sp. V33-4]PLR96672.1 hypothetical protein CVD25_11650 [Bacillus canaveralius]RSK55316.1 hypothetical protein EJA13_04135 [Bacillus canaveralius]
MLTLCSIDELTTTKQALEKLKKDHPNLFGKLLDIVNLTRALHFKYHYMGSLVMGEDPGQAVPNYVYGSVLRLYKKELQKLKDDDDFPVLQKTFSEFSNTGYAKISLLVLGETPESLASSGIR